jgi:hypothetical protein
MFTALVTGILLVLSSSVINTVLTVMLYYIINDKCRVLMQEEHTSAYDFGFRG